MTPPQKLEKIGRYQVLERVGKGGMGVLYRGFDPVLDREIAIKLMHADFTDDTEQMRPRFYREARAAAKLQHRNIVTIFEFAEESNVPYIVMEFLKGLPLGARMTQQPPLTLDDKLNVIAQLCDGLAYAHEQGVVHRDVKPDNIFLMEDGSIKLLDFGIAKLTTSTLTRQGDVLGSASYMSPEQVSGSESVDGRADVFSAGVVLYELLSGRKPFQGDSPTAVIVKILKEPPTPIESITTGLPADVIAIVMRALEKNPADRYQTAEALGRDLQTVRKALHPSLSRGNMDETRFASIDVMKALHDDYQKGRPGASSDTALSVAPTIAPGTAPSVGAATSNPAISSNPTVSPSSASAQPAQQTSSAVTSQTAITTAPPEKNWMVPALAGALVAVLAVGGFVFYSTRRPANDATTTASADAAAPGAATPAAASAAVDSAAAPAPVTEPAATQVAPIDPAQTAAAAPTPAPTPDPVVAQVAGASAVAPRPERAPTAAPAPVAPAPDPAATRAADAAAAAAATSNAAATGPTGTLYIDFVNNFPDGSVEVEVDGRRRWSEKLGFSQNVGGLSRLKIQRASENLGTELKIAPGNHRVMVTVLNEDGEVRDVATTSVSIYESKAATLKIRQTRLRNKIQLETVAGEPDGK